MAQKINSRRVVKIREDFFGDGPYYVITSTSLGGSKKKPEKVSDSLGEGNAKQIREFLKLGICLPLFFDFDCALDQEYVVIGDLTEQEESEWIGRISGKLQIPCGKLVIISGGGDPDEFEEAVSGKTPDEDGYFYELIEVPPGDYLVELYAYIPSPTVRIYFDDHNVNLAEWFQNTRAGMKMPKWLKRYNGDVPNEAFDGLVNYILRLLPLTVDPPLPKLDKETGWVGEFEFRLPEKCPIGIMNTDLIPE